MKEREERVSRRQGNRVKEDKRGMRFLFLSRTFITSMSLFWWSLNLSFFRSTDFPHKSYFTAQLVKTIVSSVDVEEI